MELKFGKCAFQHMFYLRTQIHVTRKLHGANNYPRSIDIRLAVWLHEYHVLYYRGAHYHTVEIL